jgi:uncharacterized membrane protein
VGQAVYDLIEKCFLQEKSAMPSARVITPKTNPQDPALGLERIVFFSDAVMAIAITLLAIDLKVPVLSADLASSQLAGSLVALAPRLMSLMVSFIVIGVYWTSHHRYFTYIKRYNGMLIFLNMLFLFFIILMPFVASLLGQYPHTPVGVITYAAAVAITGLSISSIWWYASWNNRLVDENMDLGFIRTRNRMALLVPILFLVSIPFAFINPLVSVIIWWSTPFFAIATLRISDRRLVARKRNRHHEKTVTSGSE